MVVVGHGMVSHRFCEQLDQHKLLRRYQVTVLGEETVPVYDRVHLGKLFDAVGGGPDTSMASPLWYEARGIALHLGQPAIGIDPQRQVVTQAGGLEHVYDILVLATGARARIPKIDGLGDDVLVYRTLMDVRRLCEAAQRGRRVAVLGGGLLGLECADSLRKRGCKVTVYEASGTLLPRQLDAASARVLKGLIERRGIAIETGYRLQRVERLADGGCGLFGEGAAAARCDLLVAAAGVIPEDTLARAAGLACAPMGGVAIANTLATSDPHIHAIGDCAAYRGTAPGLVAPGYEMAEVLAARLDGGDARVISELSRSCQLKVAGVDVAALGRYDVELVHHSFVGDGGARSVVVEGGQLVGATIVGDYSERFLLQRAIEQGASVSSRQLARFSRTGSLGLSRTQLPVAQWPRTAVVCQCARVTRGELSDLAGTCGGQLGAIQKQCRAGTICGACAPLVSELVGAPAAATKVPYSRLTGWASTLLFACVLVFVMAPSVPVAASVRQVKFAFEALWRSSLFRQVTGYTVVALFLVGLLLSARKRLSWFRWGSFGGYRALHTCLGLASVVALCVHTGLRFGSHLNFALMSVFVGAALTGAVAGVSAALEGGSRSPRARVARGLMSRLHIWMLWPLPALLAFHILAAYYF